MAAVAAETSAAAEPQGSSRGCWQLAAEHAAPGAVLAETVQTTAMPPVRQPWHVAPAFENEFELMSDASDTSKNALLLCWLLVCLMQKRFWMCFAKRERS